MEQIQKRQIAYKVRIQELLRGRYIQEEGWQPNYVQTPSRTISRADIMGVVIHTQRDDAFDSVVVDDGSGQISVRVFDAQHILAPIQLGASVHVVGRPRLFNEELYLLAEMVKPIHPNWLAVRKKELEHNTPQETAPQTSFDHVEAAPQKQENASFIVYDLIKRLDSGSGAAYEDVVASSKNASCEKIIAQLLEEGEIFEVSPGKLKVLD